MTSDAQGVASHWLRPTALALASLAAAIGLAACQPVVSEAAAAPRTAEPMRAAQAGFQIDPCPLDAAVARARADLKVARAREQLAASEAERARLMQAVHSISAEELDRRLTAHAEAQTHSAAAETALQTVQLQRDFGSTSS
jgi:multidrug resistance efflux pump